MGHQGALVWQLLDRRASAETDKRWKRYAPAVHGPAYLPNHNVSQIILRTHHIHQRTPVVGHTGLVSSCNGTLRTYTAVVPFTRYCIESPVGHMACTDTCVHGLEAATCYGGSMGPCVNTLRGAGHSDMPFNTKVAAS